MTIRQGLLALLVSAAGLGGAAAAPADAAPFTCPDTAASGAPGTARSLADLYAGADDADAGDRLGMLLADLRKSGLKPALMVDHLVGAYCPLVAADGTLSDRQKAERVRQFAQRVTGLAYLPPGSDEVEVLVQTALTPGLLQQIDQAAARAGLSRSAWIERAIRQQLAAP